MSHGAAVAIPTATTDVQVVQVEAASLPDSLLALDERGREYIAASQSANTIRAYASDWRHFVAWCEGRGVVPLPASVDVVACYLTDLAESHKPSSLTQRMSAIAQAHAIAEVDSPTHSLKVRKTLSGIRRHRGVAPDSKSPVTVDDLRAIVAEHLPAGARGDRDRALLLVGFAGAFRRSELVGVDREHIEWVEEGIVVTLPRSKTDQEGAGRKVGIPYGTHPATCPVLALRAWLEAARIERGPVFRAVDRYGHVSGKRLTSRGVALVVKRYIAAIGKDARAYSGHSLRAGHVTAAARADVAERDIMRQTGHKSEAMMRRYIRDGSLFRSNSAGQLGL